MAKNNHRNEEAKRETMAKNNHRNEEARRDTNQGPTRAEQLNDGGHVCAIPLAAVHAGQHGARNVVAHTTLGNG